MRRVLSLGLLALVGGGAGVLLAAPGGLLGAGDGPGEASEGPRAIDTAQALLRPFDAPGLDVPPLLRESTPERRALERSCLICHGAQMILGQRLTGEQWQATVAKMRDKFKAPLEPLGDEETMIVDLLTRALGPDAPPRAVALAAAPSGPEPVPSHSAISSPIAGADAARGAARYDQACAACHGKEGQGGANGPRLVGRPSLADAAAFESLLREGRRAMPALPGVTAEEARDLLEHLRARTRAE